MIVRSKNFELKLEEITKEKIIHLVKNESESKVLELIRKWRDGTDAFEFNTSGSTGNPKKILISREKITYSVRATFEFIDPEKNISSALLCINPEFIGGAMVIFRSLIMDLDLFISEPASDAASINPANENFDLVSLVPLQLESMLPNEMEKYKTILVGGAPISNSVKVPECIQIFSTYGMTETVSHIALKRYGAPYYEMTGDAIVSLDDDDGCLKFKGTLTENKWLKTNDLGNVISLKKFEWTGRKDFVINSGGIKINPELIEGKLADQFTSSFVISSVPDIRLGERLVLVVEGNSAKINFDYSTLSKYEKPKEVVYWDMIPRTASNKIDRIRVKNILADHEN